MSQEIREFIGRSHYCKPAVRELAGMLPADDAALDALVGETVTRSDNVEFAFMCMAAFSAGRPVAARHLAGGTVLLSEKWAVGLYACHMTGEKAGPLLEAVTNTALTGEVLSSALYLAARFHRDERGGKLPGTLITAARTAARNKANTLYDKAMLHATALMSFDEGLTVIVNESLGAKLGTPKLKGMEEASQSLAAQMMDIWGKPPFDVVPDAPSNRLAEGNTMRRAVARVGRNEPCPCGSGKKYKHCCIEKDHALLHHSTGYAGVTDAELRANQERFLTAVELDSMSGVDAARFDPLKIEPKVRLAYLACLCRWKLHEKCVEAMEKYGYSEDIKEAWDNILIRVAQARRKDLLDRMVKLRPEAANKLGQVEMFLAEDDPVKMSQLLIEGAMHYLQDDRDPVMMGNYAYALLQSRLCALGILVTRGLIPILPPKEAASMMEHLLQARDRLALSPDDPISDVMDRLSLESRGDGGKETAALREAQQRLFAKLQEMERYRENVKRLEAELARREQAAAAPAAPAATPAPVIAPPADEAALKELREKVSQLKESLKERHNERNQLRRELRQAHEDMDQLREKTATAPGSAATEGADHEEDLLLPQDADGNQPVRLIEFPKDFRETLASLPKSVARGTLSLLGRVAAGEPSAFVGAVRLKAIPSITRARLGIDFRLLFRLLPDRVQVVDLIPRQDLERRIKTLL